MRRIPRLLAILLLCCVFAANVYRARNQSFTADESLTYNNFVSTPLRATLTEFDANNHVLNTLLAKICVALFGVSEFTLRLPSLAGGALFLAAVFVLCRRLFGDGILLVLSTATLSLNPFTLDFLSAARGYGMALGFFLWSVEFVLRYFDNAASGNLIYASSALGLSAASNLTFTFPGVALVCAASAVLARRRAWELLIDRFLLPGLLVAFVLLAIPLSYARPSQFYVGTPSLAGMVESLVDCSLSHESPVPGYAGNRPSLLRAWLRILGLPLVPAVTVLGAVALALLLWRSHSSWTPEQRTAGLITATFAGTLLLLIAAHRTFGMLYPERRTGLYLISLFWLAAFALLRLAMNDRWTARLLVPPCAVFVSLCAFQFARQWNVKYYLEWLYDSRTKELIGLIDAQRDRSRSGVRVSVTWPVASTVEFYKKTRRLDWLQLQSRHANTEPADYYILAGDDRKLAGELDVIFRDDFAEVAVARSTAAPAQP